MEAAQDLRDLNAAVTMVTELHYEEAAVVLTVLTDRFQASGDRKRGAEALFWLGFCREKQQRFAEARDAYLRLLDSFGGTPAAHLGMQRLSRLPAPQPLRSETQPASALESRPIAMGRQYGPGYGPTRDSTYGPAFGAPKPIVTAARRPEG